MHRAPGGLDGGRNPRSIGLLTGGANPAVLDSMGARSGEDGPGQIPQRSRPDLLRCVFSDNNSHSLNSIRHCGDADRTCHVSEKDAKLAQKLGQLQAFLAIFS
jgi:hypothetical protein